MRTRKWYSSRWNVFVSDCSKIKFRWGVGQCVLCMLKNQENETIRVLWRMSLGCFISNCLWMRMRIWYSRPLKNWFICSNGTWRWLCSCGTHVQQAMLMVSWRLQLTEKTYGISGHNISPGMFILLLPFVLSLLSFLSDADLTMIHDKEEVNFRTKVQNHLNSNSSKSRSCSTLAVGSNRVSAIIPSCSGVQG